LCEDVQGLEVDNGQEGRIVDRRRFNKALLASGWAASMVSSSALAATTRTMTKIVGDIEAVTRTGSDTTIPAVTRQRSLRHNPQSLERHD